VALTEGCKRRASKAKHVGSRAVWTEPRRKGQPPPESWRPLRQVKRRSTGASTERVSAQNRGLSKFPALLPADSSPRAWRAEPTVWCRVCIGATSRWSASNWHEDFRGHFISAARAGSTVNMVSGPVPLATRIVARTFAYLIRFSSFEHPQGLWQGDPGRTPGHGRLGMALVPSQGVARTIAYLIDFFAQHPGASCWETVARPHCAWLGYGTRIADCCKNICVPYSIFFRWIARPSSQQPGGTQCECCYHVRYGPTAVEGWLLTAIGPGPFRPRVWQVNPSRYRFDVAMFSSLEELSCKLREARTSSIG